MKQFQISYSSYDFYRKAKETFNLNTLQSTHRLQCNCFCSVFWFHSSVRKPFSACHTWFTSISVCVSAGETDPEPWTPRYIFSVQVKGSLVSFKCRLEYACSVSVRWPSTVLSCSVRDLISGAGLITHQMVTRVQCHQDKNKPVVGLRLAVRTYVCVPCPVSLWILMSKKSPRCCDASSP